MENYDLRQCFVPDLSGLHIRIYQFRELLRQHLPVLSAHLDELQVELAYVSQWFLSFFAVTCPLPMLFRIYDVIFAEGASETIMRVALSLMRKNQARILACTELEDVMQLLLSRGLWDCYNYNADELVHDFVSLSDIVTKERMAALEQGYREAKISASANQRGTDAAQASADVTTAASRFLGRLWASSPTPKFNTFAAAAPASGSPSANNGNSSNNGNNSNNSNTLNPGLGAQSRPLSMVRRSASKQSLASMEAFSSTTSSAASVLSSVSTEATSVSRDSSADDLHRETTASGAPSRATRTAFAGSINASKDGSKYLHSQIEDLLTALSELQRNHALLSSQLQREKEEREEDRRAVRSLVDGLRRRKAANGMIGDTTLRGVSDESTKTSRDADDRSQPTAEQLSDLLDAVEARFGDSATSPGPSMSETKAQLRDELARMKEELTQERARSKNLNRRVQELEQELSSMREQLRESHAHVRNVHQEKQRLERQLQGMRLSSSSDRGDWMSKGSNTITASGLRELKLGRTRSTPSQGAPLFNKRASSATVQKEASSELLAPASPASPSPPAPPAAPAAASGPTSHTTPTSEHDALLLELVQAKTAEAVARQELEEMKQRLERLRKSFGLAPGETPPPMAAGGTSATSAAMGMFGRLTGSGADSSAKVSTPVAASNTSSGGFWSWRR